jgi:kynurenine formamidase
MTQLIDQLRASRIYDLGQPYFTGMPHYPTHPPFLYSLTKQHGDYVSRTGMSSAAEAISLGSHVGTHIDGLCHFSCCGKVFGGVEAESIQSMGAGFSKMGIDTVAPIIRRAVLFDVAGFLRVESLAHDFAITPDVLQQIASARGLTLNAGDVALLRTGWGQYWRDQRRYINGGVRSAQPTCPGPELDAAKWLSGHGIFAAGSDTVAFERVPSADMPVHVHLLVESGIHIIECLNLEELARDGVREFAFVASPMKIEGGTGAPVRPLAFA